MGTTAFYVLTNPDLSYEVVTSDLLDVTRLRRTPVLHSESPIALRFTQAQVATIISFNDCDPRGFYVGIVAATLNEPQIAEVWRHDPTVVLFFIMPLPGGNVGVYDASRKRYESGALADVLASIIEAASIPA